MTDSGSDNLRDEPNPYLTEDWPLAATSTMYMSGNAVYNVRDYGKPGILATVEMSPERAQILREVVYREVERRVAEAKAPLEARLVAERAHLERLNREWVIAETARVASEAKIAATRSLLVDYLEGDDVDEIDALQEISRALASGQEKGKDDD